MDFKFDDTFSKIKDTDKNLKEVWDNFRNDIYNNDISILTRQNIIVYVNADTSKSLNYVKSDCENPNTGCSFYYLLHEYLPLLFRMWNRTTLFKGFYINTRACDLSKNTLTILQPASADSISLCVETDFYYRNYYGFSFTNGTVQIISNKYVLWDDTTNTLSYIGGNQQGIVLYNNFFIFGANLILDGSIYYSFGTIGGANNSNLIVNSTCYSTSRWGEMFNLMDKTSSILIDRVALDATMGHATIQSGYDPRLFIADVIGFVSGTNNLTEDTVSTRSSSIPNINNVLLDAAPHLNADKPYFSNIMVNHLAPMKKSLNVDGTRSYIFSKYKPPSLV